MKIVTTGSDFSGVGAFDQALRRLNIEYKTVFACDMDKYARQTYIHNYGEPEYYPENVYDREVPSESLDIYMTSPPCQAFSLAGKRKGEDDDRGILFYNSHEFIQKNKPRFFIFENVKGLLSDDGGRTFQRWIDFLGGKSVNGTATMFPMDESVPYHIYYRVLNAKDFGVPQNRERIFIVGIRDDEDNSFTWPKTMKLTKRLKDVLEIDVEDKYFLSDKGIEHILAKEGVYTGFNESPVRCLTTRYAASLAGTFLKIKSATSKGYETATTEDSINFSVPNSETRRGRVGKGVAQTLDTQCNQGVMVGDYRTDEGFRWRKDGNSPAIMAMMRDTWKENFTGQNPPIIHKDYKIRRLTPRECFRLMDFPDSFTWPVSDSQAYKQAGNSIVVAVLAAIIEKLSL
jgi:DNA (cytosine-5)-methyltransferase 1